MFRSAFFFLSTKYMQKTKKDYDFTYYFLQLVTQGNIIRNILLKKNIRAFNLRFAYRIKSFKKIRYFNSLHLCLSQKITLIDNLQLLRFC